MTRSIAYRRHQRQRMLARADKVIRYVWGHPWKPAYKYADDLCKCSCEYCQPGSSGRQVKRADAAMAYQLNQLMENTHA
jgi:hypothetical protein